MFSFNNTKPFLFVDFETQMVINSQDEVFFSLIAIASQLTLECFSLLFNALEIDEFKFLFTDVYARSTLSCIVITEDTLSRVNIMPDQPT